MINMKWIKSFDWASYQIIVVTILSVMMIVGIMCSWFTKAYNIIKQNDIKQDLEHARTFRHRPPLWASIMILVIAMLFLTLGVAFAYVAYLDNPESIVTKKSIPLMLIFIGISALTEGFRHI